MIGTLVGLVAMLANLDPSDPSGLGKSLSVALLTTLTGPFSLNLYSNRPLGEPSKKNRFKKKFKNQTDC